MMGMSHETALDYAFLEDVEGLLTKSVKDAVLDALPLPSSPKTFKESLVELERIRRGKACEMMGNSLQADVSALTGYVRRIMNKDDSPTYAEVSKLSDFYQKCIHRMVNFCVTDVEVKSATAKGKAQHKKEYGVKALEWYLGRAKVAEKAWKAISIEDTEFFRVYNFALLPNQRDVCNKLIKDAVRQREHSLMGTGPIPSLKDSTGEAPLASASSSSSAAAADDVSLGSKHALALQTAKLLVLQPSATKFKKCDPIKNDVQPDLLKFFGNGVIATKG
jgi:hypothetical protein